MRTRLAVALLVATACSKEGDEQKLQRLHVEVATACSPVERTDSVNMARASAMARIEDYSKHGRGSVTIAEMQADVDEMKRGVAEFDRKTKEQFAAELKADSAARIRCDLAKRSVNVFMSGR